MKEEQKHDIVLLAKEESLILRYIFFNKTKLNLETFTFLSNGETLNMKSVFINKRFNAMVKAR